MIVTLDIWTEDPASNRTTVGQTVVVFEERGLI